MQLAYTSLQPLYAPEVILDDIFKFCGGGGKKFLKTMKELKLISLTRNLKSTKANRLYQLLELALLPAA
jgi:hypothetical protein